jgi:hypothetical protein
MANRYQCVSIEFEADLAETIIGSYKTELIRQ